MSRAETCPPPVPAGEALGDASADPLTGFYERYLALRPADLTERVALIMEAVRRSVEKRPGIDRNAAKVRQMEDFLSFIKASFPAGRYAIEVQRLPRARVRTTDRNFLVTVPGRSRERLIMVAHYDTWALSREAPGADDNCTGVEILKQYLLRDLRSDEPPSLTRTYLFSGSEECGSRGLISQLGLVFLLTLLSYAISAAKPILLLIAAPFATLVNFRFGITGTRHFVEALSAEEKSSIRAALAVDAVGEGRLYVPENEMGANFLRALFPFEGSEWLNDLLEEGAHLNSIKYNRFLAGGTTDSVAFLEERRVLTGTRSREPIPAAAVLTMAPGKCSPFIWSGKLHTSRDTPDRIHPTPLREALTVLDYALEILDGGRRPAKPREVNEHHHARLFHDGGELFLALKDAREPNRRNINTIFRAEGEITGRAARVRAGDALWWGVETRLHKEMTDFRPGATEVRLKTLLVTSGDTELLFEASEGVGATLQALAAGSLGRFERLLGRNSFLAMFATTFLLGFTATRLFGWALDSLPTLGRFVDRHFVWAFLATVFLQVAILARLFSRELPTWMDNAYRNENQADNLRSLSRS